MLSFAVVHHRARYAAPDNDPHAILSKKKKNPAKTVHASFAGFADALSLGLTRPSTTRHAYDASPSNSSRRSGHVRQPAAVANRSLLLTGQLGDLQGLAGWYAARAEVRTPDHSDLAVLRPVGRSGQGNRDRLNIT